MVNSGNKVEASHLVGVIASTGDLIRGHEVEGRKIIVTQSAPKNTENKG